ncbi:MAG: alpha/beta fold hydrolase [Gammaproteobacteria bacterium]|nr:MAG: alpha/beta fold hydrolase [Gammaproteobacteria bacterium]
MNLLKYCSYVLLSTVLALNLSSCSETKVKSAIDKSAATYSEQTLSIDNGTYKVPGILVRPSGIPFSQKIPVVVLLHGTASQKNEVGGLYQRLAIYLAQKGYASLRIDFAGTGDSPVDYRFYNLTSAQADTTAALNYLEVQPEFDHTRMGLIGFSQGGLIAQLVAEQDPRIKAMVTWSSVGGNGIDIFKFMFDEYYAEAQKNGYAVVKFPWRAQPLNFGLQWFNEIKANTSLDNLKNYNGKLLAIAGSNDVLVPNESSRKIIKAARSTDATLVVIKGADHMFNVLGDSNANGLATDQSTAENMLITTAEWLKRKL